MSYVLDRNPRTEFERLEAQSRTSNYDFRVELARSGIVFDKSMRILDAGSGSGIVARYLATEYGCEVIGCDFSKERVEEAQKAALGIPNLLFKQENLNALSFEAASFDVVICRYVLEHIPDQGQSNVIAEIFRCLKPGGKFCAIDVDDFLFNLHPQTELVTKVLKKFESSDKLDLKIGRRLPELFNNVGLKEIATHVQALQFTDPEAKALEGQFMKARFEGAVDFITELAGDEKTAREFIKEYVNLLVGANSVFFYNMFVVTGTKPSKGLRLVDK